MTALRTLERYVPAVGWLSRYKLADLPGDATAGITVAVMLIPQGMAYAMLAGLPPIVGLYASIVPLAIYALLGTSRQLAVGPVAMVSLMVAASVGVLSDGTTETTVALAVTLALLVGVMQVAMGVFRLGFLVRFLSHPVISGFTSAAALIIGLSQLKHLIGVSIPRTHYVHEVLVQAVERFAQWNWVSLGMGVAAIALLLGFKRFAPRIPGALVVVAGATLAVWAFDLQSYGVAVVGSVPAGVPAPSLPTFTLTQLVDLLPTALAISLVAFMESISVAKAFAARNKYKVDADQELIALGASNVGAAFFGGYPVTGGFSRTAVNGQAGARTGLASLITAGAIAIALLTITPLFAWLPNTVLAAIVMSAVFGLIDVKEVVHLWKVRRSDLLQLAATFVATLALGIELGIGVGVGVSLLQLIWRSARPVIARLGRVPGSTKWRDTARIEGLETLDDVVVLRLDARLYFANIAQLERAIDAELKQAPRHVVLDCGSINDIDSSALLVLEELGATLAGLDRRLVLARVKAAVRDQLDDAHMHQPIARFDSVEEAVCELRGEPAPQVVRGELNGAAA
jgi:SulP family sulfate permease